MSSVAVCDSDRFLVVDRKREELRNILGPADLLPPAQKQSGRTPEGELEVLERYQTENEQGESVVIDSSPSWLNQLPRLKL